MTRACFKNASTAQIEPRAKARDGWEDAILAGSKELRSPDESPGLPPQPIFETRSKSRWSKELCRQPCWL